MISAVSAVFLKCVSQALTRVILAKETPTVKAGCAFITIASNEVPSNTIFKGFVKAAAVPV
jgi:hypothetical protein